MKRINNVLVCNKKIIKMEIKEEKYKEFYIAFCDFHMHRGIIIDEDKCLDRHCNYYKRLYIK